MACSDIVTALSNHKEDTPFDFALPDHDLEDFRQLINAAYMKLPTATVPLDLRLEYLTFNTELMDTVLYYLDRDNNTYV